MTAHLRLSCAALLFAIDCKLLAATVMLILPRRLVARHVNAATSFGRRISVSESTQNLTQT